MLLVETDIPFLTVCGARFACIESITASHITMCICMYRAVTVIHYHSLLTALLLYYLIWVLMWSTPTLVVKQGTVS